MKESFYFPHDYNAIQDPKMMCLLVDCGLAGIGIYWVIIEILHQQPDGTISEDELNDYIKFYSKFDTNDKHLLNNVKDVLLATKLLFLKDFKIGSNRVLKNKEYRSNISEKRSIAGKKSAQSRIKSTNVEQNLTNKQQNTTKERKGKEIKDTNTVCDLSLSPLKKAQVFIFEDVLSKFPNRIGKKRALSSFNASVKTEKDLDDIHLALNNYLKSERVKRGVIQNASTWFNNWPDWINYKDPVSPVDEEKDLLRKVGLINDSSTTRSMQRSYHD